MIEQWVSSSRSATTGSPYNRRSAAWIRQSRCSSIWPRCFPVSLIVPAAITRQAYRCTRSSTVG